MNNIVFALYSKFGNAKKKKIYFQKSWLDQVQYMDWLAESPEGTNVKCKLCKKVLKILNMAEDALRSYAHSERHKQEMNIFQGIQLFFDKACMKSLLTILAKSDSTEETCQPSGIGSNSASDSTMASSIGDNSTTCSSANKVLSQSTIDTNIIFNSIIRVEIIWSFFSVCERFSNNTAKDLNQISVRAYNFITNNITRSPNIIFADKKYDLISSHYIFDFI